MAAPVAPKVAFVNLGCRVNRVEIDSIAAHLEKVGCAITAPKEAQAIVVNTCAVTGEAEAKTCSTRAAPPGLCDRLRCQPLL